MSNLADIFDRWTKKMDAGRALQLSADDLAMLEDIGFLDHLRMVAEGERIGPPPPPFPFCRDCEQNLIYFMQGKRGSPIKIGRTKSALDRLHHIQLCHHEQLDFIALFKAPAEYEKQLHQHFAIEHIRGEWFTATPRILRFAESHGVLPHRKTARRAQKRRFAEAQ